MDRDPSVRLRSDLKAEGYGDAELAQLISSGQLRRVRRGGYAELVADDPVAKHRQLISTTMPKLSDEAVLSHMSAAAVHGLPGWPDLLHKVHVIRTRPGGGRCGTVVHVHPARLDASEVTSVDGLAVTGLARTVADCARSMSYVRAVALGDAALRCGMARQDLLSCLELTARCRGVGQARRVATFIDEGAESVGESYSRIVLHRVGLPVPRLQFPVRDRSQLTVARADFGWEQQRTLGEFDGKIKYGRLLKPNEAAGDAVFREKVREDLLRDLGWEVVRWTWDDLNRPAVVVDRLRRAFARGARR